MVDLPSSGRSQAAALTGDLAGEKSGRRKLRWGWLLWLIAPALVYLAWRNLPVGGVLAALQRLTGWQIAALLLANLAFLGLTAGRWWIILRAFGERAPFWALVGYRLAGFGMSYYTPGPQFGGEPLQVYLLHRRQSVRPERAAASVYFDRLLELLANFTFLAVGLAVVLGSGQWAGQARYGLLAAVLAVLLLPVLHLGALARGQRPLTRGLDLICARWPGRFWRVARDYSVEAETAIGRFCREQPRALIQVIGASALVWAVSIGEFFLLLNFLGAPVDLAQTVGILTAARLAFLLPLPGGLGVFEASQYLALQAAGFDPAIGLAASLIIRTRDMSLGLVGLWIGGLRAR